MPRPTSKITLTIGALHCTIEGMDDMVRAAKEMADHLQKLGARERSLDAAPGAPSPGHPPPAPPTAEHTLSDQTMGAVIAKAHDALSAPEVAARRKTQQQLKAASSQTAAPNPKNSFTPEIFDKFAEFCAPLALYDDADILEAAAVYLQEHHWHSPASGSELARLLCAYDEEGFDSEEVEPALDALVQNNRLARTPDGGYALTSQTRFRDSTKRAR